MSRIGKLPITVPAGVEFKQQGLNVTIKGKKGTMNIDVHPDMSVTLEDGQIVVTRPTNNRQHRALHGLTRALLANMVTGVSEGFRKVLQIEGVGYQAQLQGNSLNLKLGFSHEVIIDPPEGIEFDVPKDSRGRTIIISGYDKQAVGQVAANIRELRPPEPYKGKGIRYEGEYIIRKAGKAGKK